MASGSSKKIVKINVEKLIAIDTNVKITYTKDHTGKKYVMDKRKAYLAKFEQTELDTSKGPASYVSSETSPDGKKILATFNVEMGNPSGKHGEFEVKSKPPGKGETDVTLDGAALNSRDKKIIEFTIKDNILPKGATTTINYPKGGTGGSIVSMKGGKLLKFDAAKPVTDKVLATPANFVSATASANNDRILIKLDKPLTQSGLNSSQFKVKVGRATNGILGAKWKANDTIELEVFNSISSGQSVTVSYTGTTLKTPDNKKLAKFSGKTVTIS